MARRRTKYDGFILRLVKLQDEAGRLGLFATMNKLHAATKRVGYEVADIITAREGGTAWTIRTRG